MAAKSFGRGLPSFLQGGKTVIVFGATAPTWAKAPRKTEGEQQEAPARPAAADTEASADPNAGGRNEGN